MMLQLPASRKSYWTTTNNQQTNQPTNQPTKQTNKQTTTTTTDNRNNQQQPTTSNNKQHSLPQLRYQEGLLDLDPEVLAEEQRKLQEQIQRLEAVSTAWDDLWGVICGWRCVAMHVIQFPFSDWYWCFHFTILFEVCIYAMALH